MIPVTVECYAGYKGEERPVRFTLGDHVHIVRELQNQWHEPDATYFRVHTECGRTYVLRHDHGQDTWSVAAYRSVPRG